MAADLDLLQIIQLANEHLEAGGDLDPETQQMLALLLNDAVGVVDEQISLTPPPPLNLTPEEDQATQLLWMLAGGNPDAFTQYLRTFPDPAFRAIQQSPGRLQQVVNHLQQTQPRPAPQNIGGIDKAPLQSSNIWGFQYDPKSGRLLVRFQGGPIYAYGGVPPYVFKVFQQGAVPAKTDGHNAYGLWYKGKIPSLGAAFYQMIREGGFPYQRIA